MALWQAAITTGDIALFSLILFLSLMGLVVYFFLSFWKVGQRQDPSPYSGIPLRYAREIPYTTRDKINAYIKTILDYDNQKIDWEKASFCRETGRIFPNSVTWNGAIRVDWNFLQKKFRGHFVSWGSLSPEKRKEVLKDHDHLYGFQVEFNSREPAPRLIEESFAYTKPGPLYVDPETHVIIGWKQVPDTAFEVLVVQKPIKVSLINVNKK